MLYGCMFSLHAEEACTYFEAEECMGDRDSGTGVNMGHADGSESDDDYGDTGEQLFGLYSYLLFKPFHCMLK